jgi:hypothetical protein
VRQSRLLWLALSLILVPVLVARLGSRPQMEVKQAGPRVEPLVQLSKNKAVIFDVPSRETYAREVKADPHRTPASLLRFAQELAAPMVRAMHSLSDARILYARLRTCAVGEQAAFSPHSVRALCAINAERLTDQYQGAWEASDLHAQLPEDVWVLVLAMRE